MEHVINMDALTPNIKITRFILLEIRSHNFSLLTQARPGQRQRRRYGGGRGAGRPAGRCMRGGLGGQGWRASSLVFVVVVVVAVVLLLCCCLMCWVVTESQKQRNSLSLLVKMARKHT